MADRLNNDLALPVGVLELQQLQPDPTLPIPLRRLVEDAAHGLTAATTRSAHLQQAAQRAGAAARPEAGSISSPGSSQEIA